MRKAAFGLGFFLLIACGNSSAPDERGEDVSGASGGEDASGGGSAGESESGRGGHSGASGTSGTSSTSGASGTSSGGDTSGGSTTGGSNQGGADRGGAMSGGSAGELSGGSADTGGTTGAAAGMGGAALAGTGGRSSGGTTSTHPTCDPPMGELDNTPYPDCDPRADTPCELCIQAECCEQSKVCYGYGPGNVCGWGGPTSGAYGGLGEIDCYIQCAREYVAQNGVYDDNAADVCVPACTTPECGLIGNATQDLVVCLEDHCEQECFEP